METDRPEKLNSIAAKSLVHDCSGCIQSDVLVQISPLPSPIFLLSCSSIRWIFFLMFLWPRFKTWWQWKMATVFLFSSQDFRTTQGSGLGFKYFPGVLCWAVAWFCLACLFLFLFFLVSEYQLVISDMFPSFKGTTMLNILVRNVIMVAVL